MALIEVLASIATIHPVLLEFVECDHVLSYTFWTFLTAFLDRAYHENLPILFVLSHESPPKLDKKYRPYSLREGFLRNLPEENILKRIALEPLEAQDITDILNGHYTTNRFPSDFAPWISTISRGIPGRVAEILELLEEKGVIVQADDEAWLLARDTSDPSWEEWIPELPAEHAALARQVLQVAATEGKLFASSVISEHLSLDKDTVDDLLDDLAGHVKEVVFHEGIKSWLYEFKSAFLRQYYLETLEPAARGELARSIATLLERSYLNRSMEYAVKSARIWLAAREPKRYW
jgi:hypothetical protein